MTLTTERQQFAEQNEMSMEFVNWFFDEKKEGCGNAWFIMAAAMWEGWKVRANREAQPVAWASTTSIKRGDVREVWPNGEQHKAGKLCIMPLYTAPPAPAVVKLPTEFYSDEGIVVRLEQVMAALAVVGVQYERKANAKTRCECSLPSLPEEMTGGIAMSKYKVKKSNYAQWVKGWSACRAAMLAQPVSSGYKLPDGFKLMPLEMTDEIGEAIAMEAHCCGGIALCIYEAALAAAPEGGNDHDTRR
ncbi:hypothetical protein ACN2W4_20900 [Serratia marcescens]|uniref:hypothetical protein n=1 Tax=Serratia marcescens TaxID=615 RepID=UPI003AFA93F5